MKTILLTLYCTMFLVCAYAQFPNPAFAPNNNEYANVNPELVYFAVMNDMSIIEVKSKIHDDKLTHQKYLIYINKKLKKSDSNRVQKIFPQQTMKIARLDYEDAAQTNRVKYFNGMPADTCWMFKAITGAINAYSYYSDKGVILPASLIAVQKGEGEIMKLTFENLSKLIAGDERAEKDMVKSNILDKLNTNLARDRQEVKKDKQMANFLDAINGYNKRHQ